MDGWLDKDDVLIAKVQQSEVKNIKVKIKPLSSNSIYLI